MGRKKRAVKRPLSGGSHPASRGKVDYRVTNFSFDFRGRPQKLIDSNEKIGSTMAMVTRVHSSRLLQMLLRFREFVMSFLLLELLAVTG
jgi:hypothetical protein